MHYFLKLKMKIYVFTLNQKTFYIARYITLGIRKANAYEIYFQSHRNQKLAKNDMVISKYNH